ncbi:hypothetical protein [Granulicella arctica]|uniref:Uncharacterized protein n=1 Tax=Granulicella arctica TaxID=940613 RepID=A0A7Y9PFY1_9BACT|nr:hypothetical protein [Granulicella arctica]NYF79171.1 hypothetical protein [Granulicella arctica]
MALSIPHSSPDAASERNPEQNMIASGLMPAEGRSIRATEMVYALFVLAAGVLLLASMV